jgi:hypothetical protein
MYFMDNAKHNTPHIHAKYQGMRSLFLYLKAILLKEAFQIQK